MKTAIVSLIPLFFSLASSGLAQQSGEIGTLSVPPGWVIKPATVSMNGFTLTSVWTAPPPAFAGDNIGIGYGDIRAMLPSSAASTAMPPIDQMAPQMGEMFAKVFGAGNPVVSHAEKVCNGMSDGWYFENRMVFGTMTLAQDMTVLAGKDRLFQATYTRLSSEKEDAAARKALDTLCIKQSATTT